MISETAEPAATCVATMAQINFSKRQLYVYAAGLVAVCLFLLYQYLYDTVATNNQQTVKLKNGQPQREGHGFADEFTSFNSTCVAPDTPLPKIKTKPIWVASFPGSGAELVRDLITSLTGQPTVDGTLRDKCRKGKVVTCKTHWPTTDQPKIHQDPMVKTRRYHTMAMVLLRNPATAIPSWYNQIWEARVHAAFHSQQAPEKNWNRFRSHPREIEKRLQQWKQLILYWAYSDHYDLKLFVPFESLVDAVEGPVVLQRMADALASAKVTLMIPGSSTPSPTTSITTKHDLVTCFWNETVQGTASMKRSEHKYQPSYSEAQRQYMIDMMDEMMTSQLVVDRPELMPVLKNYRSFMEHSLRIDELN